MTRGAGKKEDREEWEGQEEQDERDERDKTTKGKEASANKGKKLQRGRLIFRKEYAKGFKGWLYSLIWIT